MNQHTTNATVLFILWFRAPGKGERWHKIGRFGSRAEAMNAIGSKGDWRIEEARAESDAGPNLFAPPEGD